MATEVILPKLGQTMEEGTIVEWFKQEGDAVKRGEVLFAVESDKATLESESPTRGYLRKILVPAGTTVPVLTPVGIITRRADEDIDGYQPAAPEAESTPAPSAASPSRIVESEDVRADGQRVLSSPRARMRARERGVDLSLVVGTGPGGRIVEKDILAYVKSQPKATPVAHKVAADLGIDLATVVGTGVGGKVTREDVEAAVPAPAPLPAAEPVAAEVSATVPLTGLRGIIAERMATSARTTAQVTLVTEADATELVKVRMKLKAEVTEEWGFSPGYTDLLALIVARTLREHPYMNARLNGDVIEKLTHVNLGMAVDTKRGLLVPVIRDADRMGLRDLGAQFRALVGRARGGKSLLDELTGGTFTITNMGMFDVDAFTPVINLPELAILGVGRIQARPVVVDGEVVVRQMLTLSLAFDHRLVDGAPAARFLQRIKRLIENPYLLLG